MLRTRWCQRAGRPWADSLPRIIISSSAHISSARRDFGRRSATSHSGLRGPKGSRRASLASFFQHAMRAENGRLFICVLMPLVRARRCGHEFVRVQHRLFALRIGRPLNLSAPKFLPQTGQTGRSDALYRANSSTFRAFRAPKA